VLLFANSVCSLPRLRGRGGEGAEDESCCMPPSLSLQPKLDVSDFGQSLKWPNSGTPEFGCKRGRETRARRPCASRAKVFAFRQLFAVPLAPTQNDSGPFKDLGRAPRHGRCCGRAGGAHSADMADRSRLSYCEITGIVRRDGATDGTGPHPTAAIHRAPRRRGGLAARGPRALSRRAAGRTVLPAQRDAPHSDGVIP
jgi:hypothetical protein